jgi:hypothetical protein
MKAKKPTLKQVQSVRCPICGAGPGEKCELSTGQARTEPHSYRRFLASDKVSRLSGWRLPAANGLPEL